MIISALCQYYDRLLENPESGVAKPGWCSRQVKYLLVLSPEGELKAIEPCGDGSRGEEMLVPEQVKRSSGVAANFLCDTSSYLLGVDTKNKPERSIKCFEASKALHEQLLQGLNDDLAAAIVKHYENWDPSDTHLDSVIGYDEGVLAGGNLSFCLGCGSAIKRACEDESIKAAWLDHVRNGEAQPDEEMVSLVTGEKGPVARLHLAIKGVVGAQSMGASLVGFNSEAFESYGHKDEQGRNAPVDSASAQAYTTALNYLLAQQNHRGRIGDTTVVFWSSAQASDEQNSSMLSLLMGFTPPDKNAEESVATAELKAVVNVISAGKPVDTSDASFGDEFFLLGLAPNAARLAVRFFLHGEFGKMMSRIAEHYRISDICHHPDAPAYVTPFFLLKSVENPASKKSVVTSQLSASLLRAILQGGQYPESLYQNVLLRIRATREVKREHAAIIRAYLLRNKGEDEKELTVSLKESCDNEAYLLGRAFYILEQIQEKANGKANIADRYLSSACATPATTFPILLKLGNSHLSKIRRAGAGSGVYLEKKLGEILNQLNPVFPKRLSLKDQGSFLLGYYQQKQDRFTKKEEQ